MAMLAEPRRKQKTVNLRGGNKEWSEDKNKFGQRMLERMGWAPGKGLGAREDGVVQHVVARYKNDECGLGFVERADQWTRHDDQFSRLLADLHSATAAATSPPDSSDGDKRKETVPFSGVSLETKSKQSRARVHYHKFTRGKDLSRYTEKDIANILGKKSLRGEKKREIAEKKTEEENRMVDGREGTGCEREQAFTTGGSMLDYFTNKLKTVGKYKIDSDNQLPATTLPTIEYSTVKIKKKKKLHQTEAADRTQEQSQSTPTDQTKDIKPQKNKPKKKKNPGVSCDETVVSLCSGNNDQIEDSINNEEEPTRKKKKKKRLN